MTDTPLDDDLVARILENLKIEPSEQLREMLTQADGGDWSPEALQAARSLLDQRSKGLATEPKCRTTPLVAKAEQAAPSRVLREGDTVLAPSFSLPSGFSALVFLGRFFARACESVGRIGQIRGQAAYIYYCNGYRGWVRLADLKPFTLDVGTRIYCRWRGATGTIIRWRDEDEKFYIRYDDGQGEWITPNMLA
jgi:hypothetical protein